jgi:PAS domain S-box-containing protein
LNLGTSCQSILEPDGSREEKAVRTSVLAMANSPGVIGSSVINGKGLALNGEPMAIGGNNSKGQEGKKSLDIQGNGASAGVPAAGEVDEGNSPLLGNPGVKHWQAGYVTRSGLEDRGDVFFAAVEMTRMPMAVTDPNQHDNPIVFVNRAFLDMTGYEEKDVVGRNCRFLQGEQTDPNTVAEVRQAINDRRAIAVDIVNYKADGSLFWNALFIGPVFDAQGKLLYWFSSQVDITQRRVSEQAFRQAQKMEAIGQLTAGLAHDFNNLLQVITGNLEVIEQRVRDDDLVSYSVKAAQQAAEKGGKLTQQLLTFARKQRLEPRRINLNTLIVEFSDMLMRTLGGKIDLRLDLKPGLPACVVDPTHMEMALLNVIINARNAMPNGGRVAVVTSILNNQERAEAHHLAQGNYVALCVIDEGEGMSPEVVRRATEPFFTTRGPGTGLGLAMVHGFVQQSQGRLEIESEQGKGTAVRMIFPAAAEQTLPAKPEMPGASRKTVKENAQTILLVDDSDDVRQVTEAYLTSQGYRVLAAHNSEEALHLLDQHGKVDLLFTDVIMPGGMNGLVLAEKVQQRLPNLPVLLATGYMDELADQGINTATFATLSKPYRRTELINRLRSALNKDAPMPDKGVDSRHEG